MTHHEWHLLVKEVVSSGTVRVSPECIDSSLESLDVVLEWLLSSFIFWIDKTRSFVSRLRTALLGVVGADITPKKILKEDYLTKCWCTKSKIVQF